MTLPVICAAKPRTLRLFAFSQAMPTKAKLRTPTKNNFRTEGRVYLPLVIFFSIRMPSCDFPAFLMGDAGGVFSTLQ